MNKYFALLAALLLPSFAMAGLLKGKVTDSKGSVLPFATVYVQGTTNGTSANAAGEYQLAVPAGNHKIICQYIGYQQTLFVLQMQGSETVLHDFVLREQGLEMKEYVIKATDEDPAYRIIRKAIARRKSHLKQVKSFQTKIYLKGVMRSRVVPGKLMGQDVDMRGMGLDSAGKGVLYLVEEVADYYAQEPDKQRTVIHSVRQSGNPGGLGFSQFPSVVTFYENNINLSEQLNPRGFISPISEGALNYYKYHLAGGFKEGDYYIFKINVKPKRQFEPLFTGDIYIVEDEWAIHSLNMYLTQKSGMEFLDTMRIEQSFLPLQKDAWVIKSQVLYPVLTFMGFNITGNFVTVYDNQKINEPIPDTMFSKKIVSAYDKGATGKDTGFWQEARPVPLETDEARDYVVKDSINIVQSSPEYIDSVRRAGNRITVGNVLISGINHKGKGSKTSWTIDPLLFAVNFNTVEGLNIAPSGNWRVKLDSFRSLRVAAMGRYGFSNTHFNGIGSVTYVQNTRNWSGRGWSATAEGGKYVFQFNPAHPVDPLYNTYTSLVNRVNYLKLYERYTAGVKLNYSYGNGFRWRAGISWQDRIPLENTTEYSWAKSNVGGYTGNYPDSLNAYYWGRHQAVVIKAEITYQPGYTYVMHGDNKRPNEGRWPVFSLSYEKGIPDVLSSKVDFDKWRFSITGDLRLRMAGALGYNLAAGGFLNDKNVAIPDLMHIYGNQYVLAAPYLKSFQLAPFYQYSNAASFYGEAHLEYKLNGLITNKIPLFKELRWYLLAGGNGLYINDKNYYAEGFIGLDNIGWKWYRFLRVDLVQSWNAAGFSQTGFRIGLNSNLFRVTGNNRAGEWAE